MERGRARYLPVTLLAFSLVGCGSDHTPNPAPNPVCTGPTPTRGDPVDGALEIGEGGPADFRQYADGDSTAIVRGSQGGYMALPQFRVDATALGTDGVCAYLKVIATLDDGSPPQTFDLRLPNSSPNDPFWYFGSLPLFLSSDESELVNRTVTYNAAFRDDDKEADAAVSLLLLESP